jgi:DNA-binding transcriptional ArsR family regulator
MPSESPGLPARVVLGSEAMSALAVPARYAILSHLLDAGPRTASECAEVVGESPSNCSWHLRALARVGLVERVDDEDGDGRRRPWQVTAGGFEFSGEGAGRAGAIAAAAVTAVSAEHADELFRRHLARRDLLPPEWQAVSGQNRYSLAIAPDELAALTKAIDELVRPYIRTVRQDAGPDAAVVHLSLRAVLNPDLPVPDGGHSAC